MRARIGPSTATRTPAREGPPSRTPSRHTLEQPAGRSPRRRGSSGPTTATRPSARSEARCRCPASRARCARHRRMRKPRMARSDASEPGIRRTQRERGSDAVGEGVVRPEQEVSVREQPQQAEREGLATQPLARLRASHDPAERQASRRDRLDWGCGNGSSRRRRPQATSPGRRRRTRGWRTRHPAWRGRWRIFATPGGAWAKGERSVVSNVPEPLAALARRAFA